MLITIYPGKQIVFPFSAINIVFGLNYSYFYSFIGLMQTYKNNYYNERNLCKMLLICYNLLFYLQFIIRNISNVRFNIIQKKIQYAKPVTVMRELFHQYSISMKRKAYSTEQLDPLARRTLSVQKFNQCLKQLQLESTRTSSQGNNDKPTTQEKNLRIKCLNTTFQRKFNKDENTKRESDCFKSLFSQTVNLFRAHPGIKMKTQTNKNIQISNQQISKQNLAVKKRNLLFESKKIFMRNPTNLFSEMNKQKMQNQQKANIRKYKLRNMRRNWIINNLYPRNENQEPSNRAKIMFKVRMRQTFKETQQNIFPQ